MTLLGKSKTHGPAVLQTTFEGQETESIRLMNFTPIAVKIDCRDLTNRVNYDAVWRHCTRHAGEEESIFAESTAHIRIDDQRTLHSC
jgi:hypothetical protein